MFEISVNIEAADIPNLVRDFVSADWRQYASTIDSDLGTAATEQMTTTEDVDDAISLLTDTIRAADAARISRERRRLDILALIGRRRSVIRNWQGTRGTTHRDKIRVLDAAIERATAALVNERFERSVRRLNENPGPDKRKFWALVRSLRRGPRAVPVIQVNDQPLVTVAELPTIILTSRVWYPLAGALHLMIGSDITAVGFT